MSSFQKRSYPIPFDCLVINIESFDGNDEHYMNFKHVVCINDNFEKISKDIQKRLCRRDFDYQYMKMMYFDHQILKESTPLDLKMKNDNQISVWCKYLFQRTSLL